MYFRPVRGLDLGCETTVPIGKQGWTHSRYELGNVVLGPYLYLGRNLACRIVTHSTYQILSAIFLSFEFLLTYSGSIKPIFSTIPPNGPDSEMFDEDPRSSAGCSVGMDLRGGGIAQTERQSSFIGYLVNN